MLNNFNQPILKRDAQNNPCQESYLDMTFRGEYSADNLIYAGYARPGASEATSVWQIMQLNYAGDNIISVLYPQAPNGFASSEFNFAWDDRATYTYS